MNSTSSSLCFDCQFIYITDQFVYDNYKSLKYLAELVYVFVCRALVDASGLPWNKYFIKQLN
jgi:hypothetical protein